MKLWKKWKALLSLATALAITASGSYVHAADPPDSGMIHGEETVVTAADVTANTFDVSDDSDAGGSGSTAAADYDLSDNGVISIKKDGSYTITGTSADGCVTVDSGVTASLTFSDVTLTSITAGYAPLICKKNSNVTLIDHSGRWCSEHPRKLQERRQGRGESVSHCGKRRDALCGSRQQRACL